MDLGVMIMNPSIQTRKAVPNAVLNIGSVEKINQIVKNFSEVLIVVMFTGQHCSACKAFDPIFQQTQEEFRNRPVLFLKIDVHDLTEVAQQFNVLGTPTTIFIKNQKGIKRVVGMINQSKLREIIQNHL